MTSDARPDLFGEERMLIDGELVASCNGSVFETVNPATEEVLGVVADAGADELDRAIGAARRVVDDGAWATGTVGVNGGVWYSPDVPFGGYKQSGIGREMGFAGFEEYLETKAIAEPA